MKNLSLLLSILISVHTLFAGDTLKVSSEIKDVTCFFQGAQVTRSASVRLPKGKQILVFRQQSSLTGPSSICFPVNLIFTTKAPL